MANCIGSNSRIEHLSESLLALQKKWGSTKLKDQTQMRLDFRLFESYAKQFGDLCFEVLGVVLHLELQAIHSVSVSNQYVDYLCLFLIGETRMQIFA